MHFTGKGEMRQALVRIYYAVLWKESVLTFGSNPLVWKSILK